MNKKYDKKDNKYSPIRVYVRMSLWEEHLLAFQKDLWKHHFYSTLTIYVNMDVKVKFASF